MPIPAFDAWAAAAQVPVSQPLVGGLGDPGSEQVPIIAVDAAHYLSNFRFPAREPLVTALGGFPLSLEAAIAKEVAEIQSFGCNLVFVFDGLDSTGASSGTGGSAGRSAEAAKEAAAAQDRNAFGPSVDAMTVNARAFTIYEQGDATGAIETFKQAGFPEMESLCDFLKVILQKNEIRYLVAPFTAHAQMLYLLEQGAVDSVYGSSELLLYGALKIITRFSLAHETVELSGSDGQPQKKIELKASDSTFTWLEVEQCLKMLGDISYETFLDALFLSGSSRLEAFPPLRDPLQYAQPFTFRQVVDLLNSFQGNVFRLVEFYPPEARLHQTGWLDQYMRAVQAVRHMVILVKHDSVKPRSFAQTGSAAQAPSDLHELVGLALPEELLYYLYRGLIGPRVLSWFSSGKIRIHAPLAGGESDVYRTLVKEQLLPRREQTLSVLASVLNRYYQRKEITTSFWFGAEHDQPVDLKNLPSPRRQLAAWRVNETQLRDIVSELKITKASEQPGSLYFALRALESKALTSKTAADVPKDFQLQTAEEIVSNALWRLLFLRGYIDDARQLTPWGTLLARVLKSLNSSPEQAEAAFLSVEMLRLGLLNADAIFADYNGLPVRGSENERRNTLFSCRVCSTGKMKHPAKGYSGPLSRQILAYHSLVAEVRVSLRDLVEMIVATMFLDNQAERIRDDFTTIAHMLPFQEQFSAGMGILTKTYLDELGGVERPIDKAQLQATMDRAETWLIHTDVAGSFALAGALWDSLQTAVAAADDKLVGREQKRLWEEVDAWLRPCRL